MRQTHRDMRVHVGMRAELSKLLLKKLLKYELVHTQWCRDW